MGVSVGVDVDVDVSIMVKFYTTGGCQGSFPVRGEVLLGFSSSYLTVNLKEPQSWAGMN